MRLVKWLLLCLWKAIKQFFRCRWIWGGSIVGLVSFLLICKTLFGCTTKDSIMYGSLLLLAVFICLYLKELTDSAWDKLHYAYAETVYGSSLQSLSSIIGNTGKLAQQEVIEDTQVKQVLTQVCDCLEKLFSSMTKSNCSVSIKVFVKDEKKEKPLESCSVVNLVRDSKHGFRNTDKYKEINHTIIGNTSYSFVLSNVLKGNDEFLYVNNDISSTANYLNTSKEAYQDGVYPYKSELVYPLLPAYCKEDAQENKNIIGFLCIDSSKTNQFPHTEYIQEIMRIASNQIYYSIKGWESCKPKEVIK